jgi:hypothetical protein
MILKGSSSERRKCGSIDDAVEYISKRPHENFVIYDATQKQVDEIKKRVTNIIKKA